MATVGLGDDVVLALVEVVLVLDVADDLLQHVLDRDEAGHAAVLVDDDRDVVAVRAEIAQEDVQSLRFGHEHRRAAGSRAGRSCRDSGSRGAAPSRAGCRRRRPCSRRSPGSGSAWSRAPAAGSRPARRRCETTSIWARGIMMSRTVISDTCSTPSIIDSASASSSLCSNAPCRSSSSSSRSSGSRVRKADSRSSKRRLVGLVAAVVVHRSAPRAAGAGVRVGNAQRRRGSRFSRASMARAARSVS